MPGEDQVDGWDKGVPSPERIDAYDREGVAHPFRSISSNSTWILH